MRRRPTGVGSCSSQRIIRYKFFRERTPSTESRRKRLCSPASPLTGIGHPSLQIRSGPDSVTVIWFLFNSRLSAKRRWLMIRKGGYTRPQLAAFALFIISAWAQDPMAQTKDDCLLDPGAKNSPLFQKQCLNAESDPEWPQAADTTKKSWRLYSSHQMDVKAGLFRDESRVALFGLGMGYRLPVKPVSEDRRTIRNWRRRSGSGLIFNGRRQQVSRSVTRRRATPGRGLPEAGCVPLA